LDTSCSGTAARGCVDEGDACSCGAWSSRFSRAPGPRSPTQSPPLAPRALTPSFGPDRRSRLAVSISLSGFVSVRGYRSQTRTSQLVSRCHALNSWHFSCCLRTSGIPNDTRYLTLPCSRRALQDGPAMMKGMSPGGIAGMPKDPVARQQMMGHSHRFSPG
jgi:hypothetical protein